MKKKEVPPRLELGSLDSKSKVLTITPRDRGLAERHKYSNKNLIIAGDFLPLGITDCGSVGRFSDKEIWLALINPSRPVIKHTVTVAVPLRIITNTRI